MTQARMTRVLPNSKRAVAALAAVPALVLLLATTRTWVTGRTSDPLLGGAVAATGGQVAPAAAALGAVCLAATVAMLTAGRKGRLVAAVLHLLAAVGALLSVASVLRDPGLALGRVAAGGLGRSGPVPTDASVTGWVWVALVCAVVLLAGSVVALRAVGGWSGLSGRYDAPAVAADGGATSRSGAGSGADSGGGSGQGGVPPAGSVPSAEAGRGQRASAWDDLSRGVDPTDASDLPQ